MPSQKERREITARLIHGHFRDAADMRANRDKEYRKAYRRSDPSWVPDRVGPIKIKSPYLFSVLQAKMAAIARSIKANGLWVRATAQAPEYQEHAEAVTQALQSQFQNRILGTETAIMSGLEGGMKYGDHYFLQRWYEDAQGHWGVETVNVNIHDAFVDAMEQRWIILRRHIPVSELGRMAAVLSAPLTEEQENPLTGEMETVPVVDDNGNPVLADGGVAKRAFEKVVELARTGLNRTRYGWEYANTRHTLPAEHDRLVDDSDLGNDRTDVKDDPANAMVTVLEYHETAHDGVTAVIIPDNPGHKEAQDLFFQEAAPHPYGICQITKWTPWPVDNEAFGYSASEIVGGLADLHDFALRASARRTQRYADPAVKYKRRSKIKPIYLRSQSNVAIPVDSMDDLEYMDPPAGGDMHQLVHFQTKQSMDMGTGMSDQKRGQAGSADSATEAAIAQESGSNLDFLLTTRAFMAIERMGLVAMRIMAVHIEEDQAITVLGRRAATYLTLKRDALEHEYHIRAAGSVLGGNAAIRTTNLLNIFTQLAPTGAFDPNAVGRFLLTQAGFDADEFMLQKQGPIPVDPEFEHIQLAKGQPLEVSPRDNHQVHIPSHARYWARLRLDPSRAEEAAMLIEHLLEHQQADMAQQQAALAGGASAGGPSQFRPDQAGQPGQPAAFTEATQNVNQDRQAPNNGQAPQPALAPNRTSVLSSGSHFR